MNGLPMANACQDNKIISEALNLINEKQLVGTANNTKWNELITGIRSWKAWKPSYRSKWVNGHISEWDTEWFYHLPFPFVGVHWFDISFIQTIPKGQLIAAETITHLEKIISLLNTIGLTYDTSHDFVRVWGYLPKCHEQFTTQK